MITVLIQHVFWQYSFTPSWRPSPPRLHPLRPHTRLSGRTSGSRAQSSFLYLEQAHDVNNSVSRSGELSDMQRLKRQHTCFGGAVDVLDGKSSSKTVQKHFGERWNQLRGGDHHVHTVRSVRGTQIILKGILQS